MKLFAISTRTLKVLDSEFGGKIGDALAQVTRNRCEPELRGVRARLTPGEPSRWSIIVSGDGAERKFDANHSMIATATAAFLLVADLTAEIRADLASGIHDDDVFSTLDDHIPWPRRPGDGSVS